MQLSIMRRQLIAQVAWTGLSSLGQLLAQLAQLLHQQVDGLLLAVDGQVQRFQQVFAVAGLDLQRFHTRLQSVETVAAHAKALAKRRTPSRIFSSSAVANDRRRLAMSGFWLKNGAPGTKATPWSMARLASSLASVSLPPWPVKRSHRNRPPCGAVNSTASPSSARSACIITWARWAYTWRTLASAAGMWPAAR